MLCVELYIIEALLMHLSRKNVPIDPGLKERMALVGMACPAFTLRQKSTLFHAAGLPCPQVLLQEEEDQRSSPPALSPSSSASTSSQRESLLQALLSDKTSSHWPSSKSFGRNSPTLRLTIHSSFSCWPVNGKKTDLYYDTELHDGFYAVLTLPDYALDNT